MKSFIVLEGIDGSGTTTQAARLATRARAAGHQVLETREPTKGPIGSQIRRFLADTSPQSALESASLALLFAADRLEHVEKVIRPATEAGTLVICDRYLLSSLAYQGLDLDSRWLATLNERAPWPTQTVFLRIDAEAASARVVARRETSAEPIERFEHLEVQRQLAGRYENVIAQLEPARRNTVSSIDGTAPPDVVEDEIWGAVAGHLAKGR